jgi:hypothetical protein
MLSQVPLGLVESAEVQHSREELLLLCRDARSLRYVSAGANPQWEVDQSVRCFISVLDRWEGSSADIGVLIDS